MIGSRSRFRNELSHRAVLPLATSSLAVAALLWLGCGDSPAEPNGTPTATIVAPSPDARFLLGESVAFQGTATDPDEGSLATSALVWSSDMDGQIGTGVSFSRTDLSLGTHNVELVVTDSEGVSDTASLTITIDPVPQLGYQIDVRFVGAVAMEQAERDVFEQAARRWEEVIVGDLPELVVQRREPFQCDRVEVSELDQLVDDLIVYVELAPLDGPNNWIGWGAPCILRDNHLPAVSDVVIDIDDRTSLDYALALHELGHAIGFGEVWDELGLLKDPAHPDRGNPLLEPVMDASLSSSAPDQSFGIPDGTPLSENLAVGADLGVWSQGPDDGLYMSLLQFDLSGVGGEWPVTEARLILSQSVVSGPPEGQWRALEIHRVDENWSEGAVTWNSRPATASIPEDQIYSTLCDPACSILDVTNAVRAWLAGDAQNYGLAIESPEASQTPDFTVGFYSRHSMHAEWRPHLYVQPDTYFAGQSAIAAFDAIGGAEYSGAKVPVENDYRQRGESVDGHWRGEVFVNEVMSAAWISSKISSVTVGALEDMGYTVNHGAADAFSPQTEVIVAPVSW